MKKSILLLLGIAFISCTPTRDTIHIISTNDMHGAIENMPRLATLVGEYRAQDTATVLLVDAGDRWTGNPYVDMAVENGVRVDGKPITDLMNALGYDVATLGNHAFDKGVELLEERMREKEFPVIVANMDTGDMPLTQIPGTLGIRTAGGTRVEFVGLLSNFNNGHPEGRSEVFEGLEFRSPFEAGEEKARILRPVSDVLIALTHIGKNADSLLAERVPEFDLIIGGHTHSRIEEPLLVNGVLITQTGGNLRYAGVTTIHMRGRRISSIENRLVRLDTVAPDPAFAALVERYMDNPLLREAVGSLAADITKTGWANMFTDVIRADMNTDFAFYHIGGVRLDESPAGKVTMGDLYAVEPFGSAAVLVGMTLEEIRTLIMNKYNDESNPKESRRADIFPSGMTYTIVTDEQDRAIDVTFDHRLPWEVGKTYSVALSDYMFGTYNFERPEAEEFSPLITDLLATHFRLRSPIRPDNIERVTIRRR
jgi:5'-nucleotidase